MGKSEKPSGPSVKTRTISTTSFSKTDWRTDMGLIHPLLPYLAYRPELGDTTRSEISPNLLSLYEAYKHAKNTQRGKDAWKAGANELDAINDVWKQCDWNRTPLSNTEHVARLRQITENARAVHAAFNRPNYLGEVFDPILKSDAAGQRLPSSLKSIAYNYGTRSRSSGTGSKLPRDCSEGQYTHADDCQPGTDRLRNDGSKHGKQGQRTKDGRQSPRRTTIPPFCPEPPPAMSSNGAVRVRTDLGTDSRGTTADVTGIRYTKMSLPATDRQNHERSYGKHTEQTHVSTQPYPKTTSRRTHYITSTGRGSEYPPGQAKAYFVSGIGTPESLRREEAERGGSASGPGYKMR